MLCQFRRDSTRHGVERGLRGIITGRRGDGLRVLGHYAANYDHLAARAQEVGKMILAPMVKIGTLPTRLLALDYGADLVYTEEIIDFRLLKSTRIENELLGTVDYIDESDGSLTLRVAPERERGHLVLQIGTNSPERAVKVAKIVEKGKN